MKYFSHQQTKRRQLAARVLVEKGIVAAQELNNLAVVGECSLPKTHLIYFYIDNEYKVAIMQPKSLSVTNLGIHSDLARIKNINQWAKAFEKSDAFKLG